MARFAGAPYLCRPDMDITFHRTDGPHGMLLVRLGLRELGYVNRPPELRGRYRAYTITGEPLPGEYRVPIGAAVACHIWASRGRAHWSCDSEAVILAFDRERR